MDNTEPKKLSPEIFVYATNKNFLNLYDALRIGKVKVELAGYDKDSGKQTGVASVWLGAEDLKLLAHLVLYRLLPAMGGKFERFSGSPHGDYLESRIILIEWDEGDGKFARYPYRVTVSNGPGQKTGTGAITPAGEPTSKVQMRMPEADLMKTLLVASDYVRNYELVNFKATVAEKLRELEERLANRKDGGGQTYNQHTGEVYVTDPPAAYGTPPPSYLDDAPPPDDGYELDEIDFVTPNQPHAMTQHHVDAPAVGTRTSDYRPAPTPPVRPNQNPTAVAAATGGGGNSGGAFRASEKQVKAMFGFGKGAGLDSSALKALCQQRYGCTPEELTGGREGTASAFISHLLELKDAA